MIRRMMAMNHQRGLQGVVSEKRPVAPREPNTSSVLMWWKRKRGCSSCGHQWRYEPWGGSGSISRSGWFPCRLRGQPYPSDVMPPRSPPTANARSRSAGLQIAGGGVACEKHPVAGPSIDARMWKTRLEMPEADLELLSLRAQALRQPLQRRIIRAVASSTAIETRQPISSIEAKLLASKQVVVNRRLVTLA